jgi:hypothetical protein
LASVFFYSGVLLEVLESPLVKEADDVFFSIFWIPPDLGDPAPFLDATGAGDGDFLGSTDAPIF